MKYVWHPTAATNRTRHDDIWFVSPEVGWAVNSDGQIIYTKNGGKCWTVQYPEPSAPPSYGWMRCVSFSGPTDGWVGAISGGQRLWKTEDGKKWTEIPEELLPEAPSAVCGLCAVSKNVIYASGTQYPDREAAIMRTGDGGKSWTPISLSEYANLLIDNYFVDELHGWVVGGRAGYKYERLLPVILYTADGGKTWVDRLRGSGIPFPRGEWGWKIQFLNDQIGFVSLENFDAAAILKTTDGGLTWKRIEVKDQQGNVDLEGIGFLNENIGWVGGWGRKKEGQRKRTGASSSTTDGGATWSDANAVGKFINRFRFTGKEPVVAYASGATIYQCVATDSPALERTLLAESEAFARKLESEITWATTKFELELRVPEKARQLSISIWDQRGSLMTDEKNPVAGVGSFAWDFRKTDGEDAGMGYFVCRVTIDEHVESKMIRRSL
jgi:photosystem II stability/assembly factor-like uncharacterized protein